MGPAIPYGGKYLSKKLVSKIRFERQSCRGLEDTITDARDRERRMLPWPSRLPDRPDYLIGCPVAASVQMFALSSQTAFWPVSGLNSRFRSLGSVWNPGGFQAPFPSSHDIWGHGLPKGSFGFAVPGTSGSSW